MKITINIPTTGKELRSFLKDVIKWIKHPNRMKHNTKVFLDIEYEICHELNSGYWIKDISEEMKDRLTCGLPNGVINKIIWSNFKRLK